MFELKKSIGVIIDGTHIVYQAGETFTPGSDDKIISLLHQSGADIVTVETKRKPKVEKAE